MKDYIDASGFREMILCAEAALREQAQKINDLNVFPVPDGDTGTNMSLTLGSAAGELKKYPPTTVSAEADRTANALLRGARGNSGVILSLLFRGMAKRLKNLEYAGRKDIASALSDGVDAAYKAVMKPAEGTILTVSRMASKAALSAADYGADLEGVFICAIKAGSEALARTKEINPVLKKAGVVDAGGKGYMVILEAMLASLRGEISSAELNEKNGAEGAAAEEAVNAFGVFSTEEITFTFDTVFIVRKKHPDTDILPFRTYLDGIGDSLVISEGDEEFKVHVHTNIPGAVLTEAEKYGTLDLAKIENMRMQHEAVAAGRQAHSTDDLEQEEQELLKQQNGNAAVGSAAGVAAPEKEFGTVAVCAGEGLEQLFRELGTDSLVTGGQTMNPSTDDILQAVNRTPASTVFVLPNNKNIIMAAEQVIPLTEKNVVVIPTRTVPQGITAMLNFDPDREQETLREELTEAIKNVHTAMVTYAARDSDFDGHDIRAGEYIALLDGALAASSPDTDALFGQIAEGLKVFAPEMITVYYGADVTETDAQQAAGRMEALFPEADVSVVSGGQPVYYYMIAVE